MAEAGIPDVGSKEINRVRLARQLRRYNIPMNQFNYTEDSQLVRRVKSFVWRLGSYLVIVGIAWISENVGLLELSPFATTVIALVCGELTKALRSK